MSESEVVEIPKNTSPQKTKDKFGHRPEARKRVIENAERLLDKVRILSNKDDFYDQVRQLTAREILLERSRKRGEKDQLTGLYNRGGFDRKFEKMVDEAKKQSKPLTVAFADLNYLSQANKISYDAGDNLIKNAAKVLGKHCANVGRWGGDEFGLIFDGETQEEVQKIVQNQISPELDAAGVDMAIGIGRITTESNAEAKESLRLCQKAMKKAKQIYHDTDQRLIQTIDHLSTEEIISTEEEKRDTIGRKVA